MNEISKRLSIRQKQYKTDWKNIESSTKKELKKLERFTESCISELKKETRKDIRRLKARRTLAPLLFSLILTLTGMGLGATVLLWAQGLTLAPKHPSDPSLIQCQEIGSLDGIPACNPIAISKKQQ